MFCRARRAAGCQAHLSRSGAGDRLRLFKFVAFRPSNLTTQVARRAGLSPLLIAGDNQGRQASAPFQRLFQAFQFAPSLSTAIANFNPFLAACLLIRSLSRSPEFSGV